MRNICFVDNNIYNEIFSKVYCIDIDIVNGYYRIT